MTKRNGVILAVIGFIVFFLCIEGWGADWKFYAASEQILYYYDAQNITHPSKNIVRVWERWDYTEKGVLDMVGTSGKKYENLSHSIILWEINCSEKKDRGLSLTHYDHKGSVVHSISSPSDWNFIVPETVGEVIYKEVCK